MREWISDKPRELSQYLLYSSLMLQNTLRRKINANRSYSLETTIHFMLTATQTAHQIKPTMNFEPRLQLAIKVTNASCTFTCLRCLHKVPESLVKIMM